MLLRAASQLAPAGATIEIASIRGIPLYDGDVEAAEGIPTTVQELKTMIAATDSLLIVTPEYNDSIPGGATPGQGGTSLAQTTWLPILRTLGTVPWFGGRLMVSNAAKVFDSEGQMIDETTRSLHEWLRRFCVRPPALNRVSPESEIKASTSTIQPPVLRNSSIAKLISRLASFGLQKTETPERPVESGTNRNVRLSKVYCKSSPGRHSTRLAQRHASFHRQASSR
jgi:NAD(P)H-dependent FMN reductase